MNIRVIITVIIVCAVSMAYAQTQVFVSSSGNDSNNGQTWGTAKQTIAAGIAAAGNNGTVYVKAGSYSVGSQLNIPAGVSVKGGYRLTLSGTDTTGRELPGTNSRWENVSVCTILTGGGSNRIAVVNGLLEGCVMRRGVTTGQGGGVLIDGGTVRYCVIRECDAIQESNRTAEGGGAYIRNNGVLTNCVITECRGDNGPAVSGGPGSLVNNTITRNWPTHCGKVTDYDGNVYNTVVIGQQCWTHENLRTTHYNDGTAIQFGNGKKSYTVPYYYANYNALTASNLNIYGYLYNWPAVMHGAPSSNENPSGVTGICPQGWHVPSNAEWTELTNFVNSITRYRCNGYDGQISKALASKSGWTSSNTACLIGNDQGSNNVTSFTAYPAGQYDANFVNFGVSTDIWSSTSSESNSYYAYYRYLYDANGPGMYVGDYYKDYGRSVRCVKQLANSVPIVHTTEPFITVDTVVHTGGRCYDGGSPISAYGVCWSTSQNPTIEDSHTTDGLGEAVFTSLLYGLSIGETYYIRAYAVNGMGVEYGEEYSIEITPNCNNNKFVVADYDGNLYQTVKLGSQCWMKENLRTTHYADGTAIATTSGTSTTVPYWNYPNNNAGNVVTYGLLYNWPAVMNGAASSNANPSGVQGICPTGWHVPSYNEWDQLTNFVSSSNAWWCGGNSSNIAKALASKTGWSSYGSSCTVGNTPSNNNATRFGAVPAGYRDNYGSFGSFSDAAYFWSTLEFTEYSSSIAWNKFLRHYDAAVYWGYNDKSYSYSVRCLRNE